MQHNSDPYLYADDTKIFKEIRTSDDCEDLQKDIHLMYEWSDKWMLKFHPDKCKTMRIRKSNIDLKEYSLKPGIPSMEYSTAEKDVGVTIDNKLSFEKHISDKGKLISRINKTYI